MPPETAKLLWDMLDAAKNIQTFAAGRTFDDYLKNLMFRSAVERQFMIIGEAMTPLIKRDIAVALQISEYRKISGFRNALVHGYDVVDHTISWGVLENDLPLLRRELEQIIPPEPLNQPPL